MATRSSVSPAVAVPRQGFWRRTESVLGRDWRAAWLFFAPTMVLLFLLDGWPFLQGVYVSFTHTIGSTLSIGPWVGLDNYAALLHDADFLSALWLTVQFTFWAEVFKLSLGIIAALLIHNTRRFRSVLSALILLPWIVPGVVQSLTWLALYDPVFGGLNPILSTLHLIPSGFAALGDPKYALWAIVVVNVWAGIPFFTITQLAGLKSIDPELYDASSVDGANAWHRFRHITMPGLRYTIIVAELLSWIWTMNNFATIYLMTAGGPMDATRVVGILVYERAFNQLDFGSGVAMALFLLPVFGLMIWFLGSYLRADSKADAAERVAGRLNFLSRVIWPFRVTLNLILDASEFGVIALGKALRRVTGRRADQPVMGARVGRNALRGVSLVVLVLLLCFELLPFYWVFVTAFKSDVQIQSATSLYWPRPWTLDQISGLLTQTHFVIWYENTLQVAIISAVIGVLASAAGAYALSRLRWRGSNLFATLLLITYMMPGIAMLIPIYQIMVFLHLINTLQALEVAYPASLIPFACWLLMSYYRSIPEELEEAAVIDGASRAQAFFQLILPLAKPALFAVTLFAITGAWNEFFLAYVLLQSSHNLTLPVGIAELVFGDSYPQGQMMAASLLMAIPVLIVYSFAQKYMVEGLTLGSVKG